MSEPTITYKVKFMHYNGWTHGIASETFETEEEAREYAKSARAQNFDVVGIYKVEETKLQ